jgi:hypothetical protein
MENLIELAKANVPLIVIGLAYLLTAVASITPNESDNKWAQRLWDLINRVGWNVGTATNAPTPRKDD